MKKRKFRGFAEGGSTEDEDKAEGLRRSAGEKVGFLKRLRMGNIDDPESEAYKQFGAGRGRADRAAPAVPPALMARPPAASSAPVARPPAMAATPAASEVDELEEVNKRASLDTTPGPRAAATRPSAATPAPSRGPSVATSRGTNRATMPSDNRPSMSTSRGANRAATRMAESTDEGRAEIPGAGSYKAPASEGRMMGETERNVRNILSAATPGIGKGLSALGTPLLAEGVKGAQVGRAAARGAADRKRIQAARAARERKSAEALEEAKPVLQASKKKPSPRSRTRDEDADYELRAKGGRIKAYAKGGSVRGGGCEQRGLRKCKVV